MKGQNMGKTGLCYWSDQCEGKECDNCDYFADTDDLDNLVDYALDLLDRSINYQSLVDEMEGDA